MKAFGFSFELIKVGLKRLGRPFFGILAKLFGLGVRIKTPEVQHFTIVAGDRQQREAVIRGVGFG